MALNDPIADASFPAIRARRRPGTAMAAMMPMIATTISSSISVNPFCVFIRVVIEIEIENLAKKYALIAILVHAHLVSMTGKTLG